MKEPNQTQNWLSYLLFTTSLVLTSFFFVQSTTMQLRAQATTGIGAMNSTGTPDLAIDSISLSNPNPTSGELFTVTVVVKNVGDAALSEGFYTYLYIDPVEQPPTETTIHTRRIGWFLGLNVGSTFTWSYSDVSLPEAGCNHRVYAWVNRDNTTVEARTTNNLSSVDFCIGSNPSGDSYEPDNSCDSAKSIATDGVAQLHTFAPEDDHDWFAFNVTGGVEYLIVAEDVGANAQASLQVRPNCNTPDSLGGRQEIPFTAPASGAYYVSAQNDKSNGSFQTEYKLSIQTKSDCSGFYEPNDSKGSAVELATNGATQRHQFCKPGDEDWVKFQARAGITYTLQATALGSEANPRLQSPTTDAEPLSDSKLQFAAKLDGIHFVRVSNAISTSYGPKTDYDLSITAQSCPGDAFEPDNDRNNARSITVNAGSQTYFSCTATDEDWVKFTATAGITYTLESIDIGSASDTVVCLYDNIGNEIACNDDAGYRQGSRISWFAAAPGDYFAKIRQSGSAAGVETVYEFSISTGNCQADIYEPDNNPDSSSFLPTDNSRQFHNFCPADDRDWQRITVAAPGIYTIHTEATGPIGDTFLNLYDSDHTTLLASNDDFGPGLASQIVYSFNRAGIYSVEVRHFNPAKYGRSTGYIISAQAGSPTVTPTPSSTSVPPGATATPTPSNPGSSTINTVILTNRQQLAAIYGSAREASLYAKLQELANHSQVQGEIIDLSANPAIQATYTGWLADQSSVEKANRVAEAVRNELLRYLVNHSSVQYVVLAGDDRIVPSRRIADRAFYPETQYTSLDEHSTVGAAIAQNFFLTDDYFVDREPATWQGVEVYVPDWAIGRLVETPEQMVGLMNQFLGSSELDSYRTLVTGYDFVQDAASNVCQLYGQDIGSARLNCALIGTNWSGTQATEYQLQSASPFKIQSIYGHANHEAFGVPEGKSITARNVLSATTDLSGGLIYSVGCHSGLNVPENSNRPLDLAEAFISQGAYYVGNTGFGLGSSVGVYYSERLMQNYTLELLKGTSVSIGQALVSAKQHYFQESSEFDEEDEKVMQEVVLYGLPMYRIVTGGALNDENPFPSVAIDSPFSGNIAAQIDASNEHQAGDASSGSAEFGTVKIQIPGAVTTSHTPADSSSGFVPVTTTWGTYYTLDGHISDLGSGPLLPQFFMDLNPPAGKQLRSAVFTGGSYVTTTIDPVIVAPMNEYAPISAEPNFQTEGFFPASPFVLRNNDTISNSYATLALTLGKYESKSGELRLYNDVQYDIYYSDSPLTEGPSIQSVDGFYNKGNHQATFKVETTSGVSVTKVLVTYDASAQESSLDLAFNSVTQKWTGNLATVQGVAYSVQAVDSNGNATAVTRKGGYFQMDEVVLDDVRQRESQIYLPIVIK